MRVISRPMSQNRYDPLHQVAVTDVTDDADPDAASDLAGGERIAKRLARAGVCSRRDAERWIADGRVKVNGQVLDTAAFLVRDGDRIMVDGALVAAPEPTRLWRYHKPDGLVTTARDELGRSTVFENLPGDMPRVVSVGRLDLSSEGLLLLTNDGELARHLELPTTGWLREYRIRVHGVPTPETIRRLADGVVVEGMAYGPIDTVIDRTVGYNSWLTVGLREGKNREVRRVFDYLGLPVSRLIRIAYGPFQLGKLERGAVEEVPRRALRDHIPGFFPDEPAPIASAKPAAAPRMRYDRLPKAMADAAPESATKGAKPRTQAKPSASKARDTVERMVGLPRKSTKPVAAAKPAADAPKAPKRGPAANLSESARRAVAKMDRALSGGDIPAGDKPAGRGGARGATPAMAKAAPAKPTSPKPASPKPPSPRGAPRADRRR